MTVIVQLAPGGELEVGFSVGKKLPLKVSEHVAWPGPKIGLIRFWFSLYIEFWIAQSLLIVHLVGPQTCKIRNPQQAF